MGVSKEKRVLLVCSAGGHLAQMLEMEPVFKKFNYLLVTEDLESTRSLRDEYNVQFITSVGKKGRDYFFWKNFIVNIIKAFSIIIKFRPHVIISTGSGPAIPFCYIGTLFRIKIIFILTYARINTKGKSADIIYPIADEFIVQWKSAQKLYPKSKYLGGGLY